MFIRLLAGFVLALTYLNGQASDCVVTDTRVCKFSEILYQEAPGYRVTFQENSTAAPAIAAEHEWFGGNNDVIHLGETRLLEDDELFYVLAHEFAHGLHRHGRELVESIAAPEDRNMSDRDLLVKYAAVAMREIGNATKLNHAQEFDADAFAVEILQRHGRDAIKAMRGVLKSNGSSATHPSKQTRIAQARKILETVQAQATCTDSAKHGVC